MKPPFHDEAALHLWNDYVARIEQALRSLPASERADMRMELIAHVLESATAQAGATEVERLTQAISRMGEPADYFRPLAAKAEIGASPFTVLIRLGTLARRGWTSVLWTLLLATGYLISIFLTLLGVLKIFFPARVGLFFDGERHVMGILSDTVGLQDSMGFWFVPAAIGVALLLYAALTWILNRLPSTHPQEGSDS